jgi:hypothetical protein
MLLVQPTTESCMVAGLRKQLQSRKGGVVSTTVTVWLHCAMLPQSSTPFHVRVMTLGQVPLVTVLMTVTTTPLLGVPGGGEQLFVHVGGLKLQVEPHSTVLLDAQSNVNAQPPGGWMTV